MAGFDLVALLIDAQDPAGLARFWALALGWEVDEQHGDRLRPTDGTRFTVRFVPTGEPKTTRNVIHLDLTTTSVDEQQRSVAAFLAAGARPCDVGQTGDEAHVVLADPEGNELCLLEHTNTFLAGCGRFGSITCDGTPAVGYFWSAVLGWPLVWDQDEETAIRAPDLTGPLITWGPPVPDPDGPDRLHLEITPAGGTTDDLLALGATRTAGGYRDPDGNLFTVVERAD